MSILLSLVRQNLIARRNNLEFQMLQNSESRYGLLRNNLNFTSTHQGKYPEDTKESISSLENSLDMEQIASESELMAINAELGAIRNYQDCGEKLNIFA